MSKIDELYKNALKHIMDNGIETEDKRLFHKDQPQNKAATKAVSGLSVTVDLKEDGFPLVSLRKLPVKLFVAESIWFLTGENTTENYLQDYTKIWEDFKEDDGTVTSYGNRWRKWFDRDQLFGVLETLKKDPSSRHGVMITWDPSTDSLVNGVKRKNVPCQIALILNIIGGRLNIHSIWRSVDMILGFPHDIAGNALLGYIFAKYLGVEPGLYTHYIVNAHIYNIHYDVAKELISRKSTQEKIELNAEPDWFEKAENGDHALTEQIIEMIKSGYKPQEAIKGIKIVV